MKIIEIRGYPLEAAMSSPVRNSTGVIHRRSALVLQLVTDSGLSGWGETQEDTDGAWGAIASTFARHVLGVDPFDAALDTIAITPQSRVHALAASAIDIAVWDLRGRILGLPLADLIGEVHRDQVTAYASGPFMAVDGDPYATMVEQSSTCAARGYSAIKLRCGVTPTADLDVVARVGDHVGEHTAIMIDVNAGYTRDQAVELLRLSKESGLAWIEEPVESTNPAGFAELASLSDVALAGGESLWREQDFAALIGSGGLTILQPDLYLCGGISGMLRLAAMTSAANITLLPHVFGSSVNFAASLQVAAVLEQRGNPNGRCFPWFELDQSDNPLRQIGVDFAITETGMLDIPTGPGLGVEFFREQFEPFNQGVRSISQPPSSHSARETFAATAP